MAGTCVAGPKKGGAKREEGGGEGKVGKGERKGEWAGKEEARW